MELYVRHFVRAYKTGMWERTPTTHELDTIEALSPAGNDDMLDAVAERMVYLLRVGWINPIKLPAVQESLERCIKINKAVKDTNARAEVKFTAYFAKGGRTHG
jgi:hypothetical protein